MDDRRLIAEVLGYSGRAQLARGELAEVERALERRLGRTRTLLGAGEVLALLLVGALGARVGLASQEGGGRHWVDLAVHVLQPVLPLGLLFLGRRWLERYHDARLSLLRLRTVAERQDVAAAAR